MSTTDEEYKELKEKLQDMTDVLTGEGAHADHERTQIGRCVACECGARVMGNMVAKPKASERKNGVDYTKWEAVMPDGFVAYRGTNEGHVDNLIDRHPDWRKRRPGQP